MGGKARMMHDIALFTSSENVGKILTALPGGQWRRIELPGTQYNCSHSSQPESVGFWVVKLWKQQNTLKMKGQYLKVVAQGHCKSVNAGSPGYRFVVARNYLGHRGSCS